MNKLSEFAAKYGMNEIAAMNLLQEKGGIISDNCVWMEDVADVNCEEAIAFLRKYVRTFDFPVAPRRPKIEKCPLCGAPIERCCC